MLDAADFVLTRSGFLRGSMPTTDTTGVFQYTLVVELYVGNGTRLPFSNTTPTTVPLVQPTRIHRIPRCCLGLSKHPAIRLVWEVNVVMTALEFMDVTVLYVETGSTRSLLWRRGLKTQWLWRWCNPRSRTAPGWLSLAQACGMAGGERKNG